MELIGTLRVLVRFDLAYENGTLHDRLATVDPGRIKPYAGNPDPAFHEVCVTFTDHQSKLSHRNVDVCFLHPEPPRSKSQSLLLLCTPRSRSPTGPYGPYKACKVERTAKTITVVDEATRKKVKYNLDECVRVLEENETK